MTSWARPGVKVFCVAGGFGLTEGGIYTVRAIARVDSDGHAGIQIVEVSNSNYQFGFGFRISRFRPLVTKSQDQDVALFRHLLTKQGVDA